MTISCGAYWIASDRRSHLVQRQFSSTPVRPPLSPVNWTSEVVWFNLIVVVATPLVSLYGLYTTPLVARTVAFCVLCYLVNMIGRDVTLIVATRADVGLLGQVSQQVGRN